ncbi:MAG TPA: permease prefix domain 1-containing protein [Candidatus Limnocylindrales bacterium]
MTTATTTTATLTDRYVDATLRRLPARQRPDIEKELRASIADAVQDRVEAGTDPAAAEHAVLADLGDPARLAAGYADRPMHLIGPGLYLDYVRLLAALLVIVVPAVAGVVGFARVLQGGTAGSAIGEALGTGVNTGVHIAFWTTLLFAILERTTSLRPMPARPWTPDALPQPPSRRARQGTVVAAFVGVALLTTFVLLSPFVSTETDANGDPISILSPWLARNGVGYVFVGLAVAGFGLTVAKNYLRWNPAIAVTSVLLAIGVSSLLIWLAANDRLLNPAFVSAAGWTAEVAQWINIGMIVAAVLAIVQNVVEAAVGFRARSWETPEWNSMIHTIADGLTIRSPRR